MALLNINALAGFSPALDALTDRQRAELIEVVFCYRLGVLSTTAVFNDAEVLSEVAGQIPDEVARANTRRYGVDLESLTTGESRFYTDGDEPGAVLLGFTYAAMGKLAEWKRYRCDPDNKHSVLIDRKRCAAPTLTALRLICDSEASLMCGEFLDGSYKRVSGKCAASGGWQAELAARAEGSDCGRDVDCRGDGQRGCQAV